MLNPIIIIGAPRSGTNMLRDALCELDELTTWPCDEINPIWRYGNRAYPNDQFPRSLATPAVQEFIRKKFARQSRSHRIVEKTCANSLRVDFVDEVFPNAQFIFIIRDGQDAAASATIKRQTSIDYADVWSKVRFVPITDIYYYGIRYFTRRLQRIISRTRLMKNWGPIPSANLKIDGEPTPLQLSAHQWSECVKISKAQLEKLGRDRYITVHYEDFVANPLVNFVRILDFINVSVPSNLPSILSNVNSDRVGKARRFLSRSDWDSIRTITDVDSPSWAHQGKAHD